MKNKFSFLSLVILIVFSCSSNNTNIKENTSTTDTKSSANQDINNKEKEGNNKSGLESTKLRQVKFPEHLKKYLTKNQVDSFELAVSLYNNIKSSSDLAKFYTETLPNLFEFIRQGIRNSNPEIENSGDDSPVKEWNVFQSYMPFIRVELLCSECMTEPITNLVPLGKKAKETPEPDDDKYFILAVKMFQIESENDSIVYDGGGNFASWFTMDGCDFCSYNNLGENIIFSLLKLSEESMDAGKNFEEPIQMYRNRIIQMKSNHYGVSKREVLAEIAKILKECKLSKDERDLVLEAQNNIKTNRNIQFNCKNGSCAYE